MAICVLVAVKDKVLPSVRLLLYDAKADRWSRPAPQEDVPPKIAVAGYYDPHAMSPSTVMAGTASWCTATRK
jgi:hypothetical protein